MESDFLDFTCPYCGKAVTFPKAETGKLRECPNCLESLIVPEAEGSAAKRIPFPIRTERLVLQRFKLLDAMDVAGLLSDSEMLRFLEWEPMPMKEVEDWIADLGRKRFPKCDEASDCWLAIKTIEAERIIGAVNFWFRPDAFNVAEFEMVIHRDYRRKGYGEEALRGLLAYSFDGLRAHRAVVCCDARNSAARGLLQKAGFRQEGEFIKDRLVKDEWVSDVSYAILKEEYDAAPRPRVLEPEQKKAD